MWSILRQTDRPLLSNRAAKAKLSGGSPAVAQQSSYSIGLGREQANPRTEHNSLRGCFGLNPRLQSPLLLRAIGKGLVACHANTIPQFV